MLVKIGLSLILGVDFFPFEGYFNVKNLIKVLCRRGNLDVKKVKPSQSQTAGWAKDFLLYGEVYGRGSN